MEIWIIWLAIAIGLLLTEVLTQMIWTICLAIGCLVAMVLSLCDVNLLWQVISLSVASVIAFFWIVPVARRWHEASLRKRPDDTRTGMDALLGRRAAVIEDVTPDKLGRVRIDGDCWQASCRSGLSIPRGSEVVVTAYDSIVLLVEPPEQNN